MATQAFLDAFRSGGVDLRHLLLLIVPRDDGLASDILYLSDSEVGTLGGVVPGVGLGKFWQSAVLDFGPISCPGAFCGTSVALCTTSVTLNADKPIILSSSNTASTLRNMLQTHVMTNASATIYRMVPSLAGAGDAQMLGEYRVISFELDGSDLRLQLRQRTDWNKAMAPRYVNRQEYPRAPESSVGLPLPIIYGFISPPPLRRPWTVRYGSEQAFLGRLRGGKRASAAVLVDSGRGGGASVNPSARVLVAGHGCKSVYDATAQAGTTVFMESNGKLVPLEDGFSGPIVVVNTPTEAGIMLPDNFDYARYALPPAEVMVNANSALNPRSVLSPGDTSFALLDQAMGYRDLRLRLASPGILGEPAQMNIIIGYSTSSPFVGCRVGMYNDALTVLGTTLLLTSRAVPGVSQHGALFTAWGTAPWPTVPWDFSTDRILRVFFNQTESPSGWARIYFVGLSVIYKPQEELVQTERYMGGYRTVQREAPRGTPGRGEGTTRPYSEPVLEPAVTELRGKFYCNIQGQGDDGSGTYTGTASALIERLPDIVRHLLVTYGAESAANIETGASTLGSLVAARAVLIDERGADLKFALSIASSTDMMTALAGLCASGLAMPHISPYDNKWKMVVWQASAPTAYPWKFSRWDIVDAMGPKVEHTPLPDLLTGVRVAYGYNAFTSSYDSEVALSHARSVAGHEYFGLRDQLLTVTAAVNDRLNFKQTHTGATIFTLTLTAGDYATPHLLAKHVTARIRVAAPDNHLVSVCNVIEEGVNDRLDYDDGAGVKMVAIKPGVYTTMANMAAGAQRALNQTPSTDAAQMTSGVAKIVFSNANWRRLAVGNGVTHAALQSGTVVTAILPDESAVSINLPATTTTAANQTVVVSLLGCTFVAGDPFVTVVPAGQLVNVTRGQAVTGHAGIPSGALVRDVTSTGFNLGNGVGAGLGGLVNATAPGTAVSLFVAASSAWLVRYAAGKFGVSKTGGTRNIRRYTAVGIPGRLDSAWGVLGFSRLTGFSATVPTTPTYMDADDVRFEDHLCLISLESTTDILISTGADGQDSATAVRHCGDLLGTSGESDILQSLDAPHGTTCFFTPKGNREIALRKTAARYGARRDVEIEGRAIYETRTALSLRNRIADLLGKPRTIITFNTTKAPDIERGDVFEFRADMDDFLPYPGLGSDGLWTGKRFIVTNVTHHLGPSSRDTTIVAVDVTD